MEDKLTAAGAEYTGLPITLDGNIITGEALGAAIPFALALASRLARRKHPTRQAGHCVPVLI